MSDHLKGLLLTTVGVLVLSPDSLLVRLIETDQWTLLFWRGALMALSLTLLTLALSGRGAFAAFRAVGGTGLYTAVLFSGSTLFFISSLSHTSVANTLVIICAAPLFAAIFSRLFLNEIVALRTWVTAGIGLSAIAFIVSHSSNQGTLVGDLCALAAAMCLAGTFVIIRYARAVSMIPAMAISGLLVAIVVAPWAMPAAVNRGDIGLLLLLCVVVLPLSIALITLGPRYLSAPEVSLIMLLETALGPLWVWLVVGEQPSWQAVVGGGILITALVTHSLLALYRDDRRPGR